MKDIDLTDLDFDNFDEARDPRPDINDFDGVVDSALSRRGFLGGAVAFGSGAMAMGTTILAGSVAEAMGNRFGFTPIDTSTANTVMLPEGYEWEVLVRWGQPMWSGVADVDIETGGSAETLAKAFGDNTDGMSIFGHNGHEILAVNNEYIQNKVLLKNREDGKAVDAEDVQKMKNAHGVSVLEITEGDNGWEVVLDSPYNRRINIDTELAIQGPAAGHDMLKTDADPTGTKTWGTWNNCGNGQTPWGTYLTCEENFNGYFGTNGDEDFALPDAFKRYGIKAGSRYGWDAHDDRFDLTKNINEPNRAGYIVEIDATDPDSTPIKRTALGRFKHENAEVVLSADGRVVVYLGDDERGEFLYKFVSTNPYVEGGDTSTLLDEGQLYVAKFHDNLTGEWLALTPETTGMDAAMIAIHTRMAGSAAGATTMDRPEWVAVNPLKAEAYCALTNNKNRGLEPNAGGDETPVGGPNPREANNFGQIVRWRPKGADHASDDFTWDLYVMAGNPTKFDDDRAGSPNVNAGNMFNSPDGMVFDDKGLLWIQTDGNFSNADDFEGQGNNQMLIGDPVTGEIARFMVGPKQCEVTGLCFSLDRRTAFVGIQHPGEDDESGAWPDGPGTLPRSAVIAVKRTDGGVIG